MFETQGFKVRLEFMERVLGSQPNRDVALEYLAKKNGFELPEDEVESLPDAVERGLMVFHRNPQDEPILFNYQIKGFIKEAATVFNGKFESSKGKPLLALRSKVERTVFIFPRQIKLNAPEGAEVETLTRPLTANTPQGKRTTLVTSEMLPEGTWLEFQVEVLPGEITAEILKDLLDFGYYQGLGQWRSGGFGTFRYTITPEAAEK